MFDGPGKLCLQKLANAAEKAFAERALVLGENRLIEQNNESKSRVSVKSTVIGKGKVLSYGDIVEAQNKRDAKEAKVGSETRRGSKRKSSLQTLMVAKSPPKKK